MPLCGRMPQCISLCCEFVQGAWDWQEPIPRHRAFRVCVCVFQNHIWAQKGAPLVDLLSGGWDSGVLVGLAECGGGREGVPVLVSCGSLALDVGDDLGCAQDVASTNGIRIRYMVRYRSSVCL